MDCLELSSLGDFLRMGLTGFNSQSLSHISCFSLFTVHSWTASMLAFSELQKFAGIGDSRFLPKGLLSPAMKRLNFE